MVTAAHIARFWLACIGVASEHLTAPNGGSGVHYGADE